jgi:hypothetical protein
MPEVMKENIEAKIESNMVQLYKTFTTDMYFNYFFHLAQYEDGHTKGINDIKSSLNIGTKDRRIRKVVDVILEYTLDSVKYFAAVEMQDLLNKGILESDIQRATKEGLVKVFHGENRPYMEKRFVELNQTIIKKPA